MFTVKNLILPILIVTLLTSCSQTEDVQDDVSNTQQLSSTAVDVKIEETEAVETEVVETEDK